MHRLTGKQCRQARALLKWNIYDLATHVNSINARRIESYERGMVHLVEWENDELVTAFRKEGIVFNADMDVTFNPLLKHDHAVQRSVLGEGGHITLDAEQNIVADSTVDGIAAQPSAQQEAKSGQDKEEEKGLP